MGENDLLQIGDVVRLPIPNGVGGPVAAVSSNVVAGKQVHVIRTGETLWTIAARYKISWEDIAAVNGLGEYDLLQIGEELKLPASLDEPQEEEAAAKDSEAADSSDAAASEADSSGETASQIGPTRTLPTKAPASPRRTPSRPLTPSSRVTPSWQSASSWA